MTRVIRYYDKTNDSYIGEAKIQKIPLVKLQDVFEASNKNPMYDSFLIGEKEVEFIQKYVIIKIEINKYDYFLEYD